MTRRFATAVLTALSLGLSLSGAWAQCMDCPGAGTSSSNPGVIPNTGLILQGATGNPANTLGNIQAKPQTGTNTLNNASTTSGISGASPSANGIDFSNGITLTGTGSSVGGLSSNTALGNLKGLDLETAMMLVQSQRANVLDVQLKTQLESLQKRNEDISKLNILLGKVGSINEASDAEWTALIQQLKGEGFTFGGGGTCRGQSTIPGLVQKQN